MFDGSETALRYTNGHEHVLVEAWGENSIRVRASEGPILDEVPGALLSPAVSTSGAARRGPATLSNGRLTAEISPEGLLSFRRSDSGAELLSEAKAHFWWPGPRLFLANGNGYYRIEQRFEAYDGEKLVGLGQRPNGRLDQKGLVLELIQRNAEVSIPFLVSSRGYGFLWNSPAVGRVELAYNGTRWVADSARQIDYWVTAEDTPAGILTRYADATGHPPRLPSWASGFWQSKLRYRTQDELLAVAREYRRRGVPVSVIVNDFFHWPHLGDWDFFAEEWPDPAAMTAELEAMGTKLMVSVWPSVSPLSTNYGPMSERGLLVANEGSTAALSTWPERGIDAWIGVSFYDPTNADGRAYIWEQVDQHYGKFGVELFWLDACEPEIKPGYPARLRFAAGPGLEVATLYPREHARAFYEGLRAKGVDEVLTLCRSAWAGSQRYGAAVWSGDIPSTFASLACQVKAGLNMAMSGIPWWGTDIGGFIGGDAEDAGFRELLVRWFEYGAFSPLFRLHGDRQPNTAMGSEMTGGPNEIWSFGEEVYEILRRYVFLRERLRPYLHAQADVTSATGVPIMRPLLLEFPADPVAWEIEDEFLFGSDVLVAPVLELGARRRSVYLPEGASWTDAWSGESYEAGAHVEVEAPLEVIPLFLRDDARLPIRG